MNLRLITLLIIFLFSLEKGVFAHDLDKHESFGIIPILPNILLWISLFFVGFIWFKLISSLNHIKDSRAIKISKIIGFSFLLWLIVIILQNWSLKGNNYNPILHSIPFNVGYIVLPFTLLSLLRLAYILSRKYLRELFKTPRYWFYFSGIIFLYSFFYLFASGLFVSSLIALPSSEDLPRSSNSFLLFSKTYGPLTMWDTVDFWLPNIKLYGVVSIGTLMMMLSVSILMAVNIFMVIYGWNMKKAKKKNLMAIGSTTGSSVAMAATSFCCCCLPALYPVIALLFGAAAAETISIELINSSGLLFNVIQIGLLSLIILSIIATSRIIKSMEPDTCTINLKCC